MPRTLTASTAVETGLVAEIRDLHVGFTRNGRQVEAVRGIDLDIRQGEILGLVGESGSGRSVLSLALLGLLRTRGRAVRRRWPAPTWSPPARRSAGRCGATRWARSSRTR